jgi:hypothetical protein
MADNGSILVTGAAGQLGAVGRTVTGLSKAIDTSWNLNFEGESFPWLHKS